MRISGLQAIAPFILAMSIGSLGCEEEAPPAVEKQHNFTLEVDVTDAQENALAKVPVTVDGKIVGHTDAAGKFTAVLTEFAGKEIELGVVAPDGYRFPPETDKVVELLKVTSVNNQESGVPVFLSAQADSLKKDYFVWVKAVCNNGCDDWPVTLDGKEVARTNGLGYAHFSFTDEPGKTRELQIVSTAPYKPENPTYTLELELDSTVYRIEQPFNDPTKRKVVTRVPGKKPKGKTPADATKKPPPDPDAFVDPRATKKDDGDYNGIDLF